jgi:hypothetical protein
LIFPFVPLLFEWVFTRRIVATSVTLVACNYALAIAFSTRHVVIWMLGVFLGVVFAAIYGFCAGSAVHGFVDHVAFLASCYGTAAVFFLHTVERFVRHVIDKEAFPEFLKQGGML